MNFHRNYALRGFFGDSGGNIPSAEAATFGADSEELGIEEYTFYSTGNALKTCGWQFSANEPFTVLGLRFYEGSFSDKPHTLKLWNTNGEVVKEVTEVVASVDNWSDVVYFDEPVSVATGDTYVVSMYCAQSGISNAYAKTSTVTFNSKVTHNKSLRGGGNSFPTEDLTYVPLVDIVIGSANLPDFYKVERFTMDDIASEVQRITGTTTKVTPEQIITALEGVTAQTT